ncbi:MAG: replication factor C large subunit [Candidatus Methanomethylophilaceae archaeon]|nr:replication factor C large subunit [Candidatus Methanomethylophilaceae archaeon]
MSPDWTEKYRPQTLDGVVGNPQAVNDLRNWAAQWNRGVPKNKAVVLMGPPGIGKTTSAEALARDMGWGIVEMNASDQRTAEAIRTIALRGAYSDTFNDAGEFLSSADGGKKLIVLDEADSLFGNVDRGAVPAIVELIRETRQPVILIVNDFYALSRKSSAIKSETLQITFKRPIPASIVKALKKIVAAEGIEADTEALAAIAANSNGDMRAAVRDLESIAMGRTVITEADTEHLSNRIVQKSIYDLMYNVFRKNAPSAARKMMMDVDEDTDMVMLWVDENMPYEYKDRGDLVRGYERLSRADIFMGRIRRRQYYGFLRYASDMMSMGVASAKKSSFVNRERFRTPSYLTKMSRSKGMRSTKKEACLKLAEFTHNSTKRVSMDVVPALRQILQNDPEMRVMLIRKAELEEDELAYVMGVKSDSKVIKDAFKAASEAEVQEPKPERKEPVKRTVPKIDPPAPVAAEIPKPTEKPKPTAPRSGQKSLFDF